MSAENDFGCSHEVIIDVQITAVEPQAYYTADKMYGCRPLEISFTNLSANAIFYEWIYDNEVFSNDTNPVHIFDDGSYYQVFLKAYGYCDQVSVYQAPIDVFDAPIVDFEVEPRIVGIDQVVRFTNYTTGGVRYIWEFGDGNIKGTKASNPSTDHKYQEPGLYDIKLTAFSLNSCVDSLIKTEHVLVSDSMFIKFPNAFSPNGDGFFDYFIPTYNMIEFCRIEIYNRRGQLVFITEDYQNTFWDGTVNGRPLPMDTYLWRASGRYLSGKYFNEIGEVTIIR